MNKILTGIIILVALLLVIGLAACGDTKSDSDAGEVNKGSADVLAYPDGFRNVAHKCDGPNMVYSASRGGDGEGAGGAVAVAPNDPRCKGVQP
jgi:hypothetical protein